MNLNEYFSNPKKFKNKIIVISVKDEASKFIKNFKARTMYGLRMDLKFRGAYVAVVDFSRDFLYEKSSMPKISCSYKVGKKYIDIVSAGFDEGNIASIKVDGDEYSLNKNGLNIAIFKHKSLKLVDSFCCDTFTNGDLVIVK